MFNCSIGDGSVILARRRSESLVCPARIAVRSVFFLESGKGAVIAHHGIFFSILTGAFIL